MRCRHAILFGVTLTTRCDKDADHIKGPDGWHEGPGLAEFPYQRVQWLSGDRREFLTDRDDKAAWEGPELQTPDVTL